MRAFAVLCAPHTLQLQRAPSPQSELSPGEEASSYSSLATKVISALVGGAGLHCLCKWDHTIRTLRGSPSFDLVQGAEGSPMLLSASTPSFSQESNIPQCE